MLSEERIQHLPDCLAVFVINVFAWDSPQCKGFWKLNDMMLYNGLSLKVEIKLTLALSRLVFTELACFKHE